MASHDKTEKATPKKREDARKKGQVARSVELNGAVVLMASLLVLPAAGPLLFEQTAEAARRALALVADPSLVSREGIWTLAERIVVPAGLAVLPIGFACLVAGVVANLVQVGFKPTVAGIKPDPKKLNPVTGAKNIFGQRALVETGKSLLKVAVVGAITVSALLPRLDEIGAAVGLPPAALVPELGHQVLAIARQAAAA